MVWNTRVHIGLVIGIVKSTKLSSLTSPLQIIYGLSIVKHRLTTYLDAIFPLPLHMLSSLLGSLFPFLSQLLYFSAKLSLNTLRVKQAFYQPVFCIYKKNSLKYEFMKDTEYDIFIFISQGLAQNVRSIFFNEEMGDSVFDVLSVLLIPIRNY